MSYVFPRLLDAGVQRVVPVLQPNSFGRPGEIEYTNYEIPLGSMRLIGHLPSENSAVTFSDFLCLHGIQNLVESEKDGWAVWIHSEDEIPKAKDFLHAYVGNPQDPKYVKLARQVRQARDQREREAAVEEGTAKPVEKVYVIELGPVTLLVMLASIAVFALPKL